MGNVSKKPYMSPEDYLAWEENQLERHDYIDGEVYEVSAMAGADDRHVTVTGNAYMALRQHLAGTPCRTFMSDMRVQVDAASNYFYPDVVVTCSAADKARHTFKTEPKLIIEVLSPSTAAYDRGAKFSHFRQIVSLQEYVLIDIHARTVDVFRVNADGLWVLHPFAKDAPISLSSVDLTLSAVQLFAEVDSD